MIIANFLSTSEDIRKLTSSKKLTVWVSSFYQGTDNQTAEVVFINDKQETFFVLNEPSDDPFWGEIDRLSLCYDKNCSEELLRFYTNETKDWRFRDVSYIEFSAIQNPRLSVFRQEYEIFSVNEERKEKILADFALLLENESKNILIFCADGANLFVCDEMFKIKNILIGAEKII